MQETEYESNINEEYADEIGEIASFMSDTSHTISAESWNQALIDAEALRSSNMLFVSDFNDIQDFAVHETEFTKEETVKLKSRLTRSIIFFLIFSGLIVIMQLQNRRISRITGILGTVMKIGKVAVFVLSGFFLLSSLVQTALFIKRRKR